MSDGWYLMHLSIHGLIRGRNPELGRDADTGGQVKYAVELARALGAHPQVERVDLLTRQIHDDQAGTDYARPQESLGPCATLVRLPCGPREYLRKEQLWPHLDSYADAVLQHVRRVGRVPDVIHAHYADAGYVGARVAGWLGVPLIFTGHSLGREKLRRLLDQGASEEQIEAIYNIRQRIEAEEQALEHAALVVASTRQEIEQQYAIYDNYHPRRMEVIAPGLDLGHFHPPGPQPESCALTEEIARFLQDPSKPMILALARPDPRKNLAALVRAFGEHPELRTHANLVICAGQREDIENLDPGPQEVLTELLMLIDRYDLYGTVAYPKWHDQADVPMLYRMAARSRGVFVNPALTEPFGLTLIEAAASGLPVVATADGGPQDIIASCRHGQLVDPLDSEAIGVALYRAVTDRRRWRRWSQAGMAGARQHYSWPGHVQRYLKEVKKVVTQQERRRAPLARRNRLPLVDRALICDIDNTLLGDRQSLAELLALLQAQAGRVAFGIATGRRLESALKVLREWGVPRPDLLITSVGSEIHYGPRLKPDSGYARHIEDQWDKAALRAAMKELPGIRQQPADEQRMYKLSYFLDPQRGPAAEEIRGHLRRRGLSANVIHSHDIYLDLLPARASKGAAVHYVALKWGIALGRILVAGDSGNDAEMLCGQTLGVVVGNHSHELKPLRGRERIHFASGHCARGIIEGLSHYDFFGEPRPSAAFKEAV